MAVNTTRFPLRGTQPRSISTQRARAPHAARPSDDEILGLVTALQRPAGGGALDDSDFDAGSSSGRAQMPVSGQSSVNDAAADESATAAADTTPETQGQNGNAAPAVSPQLAQILDANPQLRDAWDAAQQFRAVFSTPAAAQDAKNQLDELDGMFFSGKPGDQAALAARIHNLSPAAFHGLAQAMQAHSAKIAADAAQGNGAAGNQPAANATPGEGSTANDSEGQVNAAAISDPALTQRARASAPRNVTPGSSPMDSVAQASSPVQQTSPSQRNVQPMPSKASAAQTQDPRRTAQFAFFHSTNSAAVHQVVSAIESQVNHLLPAGISAPTKTRIVGEIYRDLSSALSANRQLGQQLRDAFRSGAGDAAHQQAIVALVAGRAKQALPSIARRVIGEWTQSVVSANQEKLSRQDKATKRVDISGAGSSDGVRRKPLSPRDLDYKRMSDADILNL